MKTLLLISIELHHQYRIKKKIITEFLWGQISNVSSYGARMKLNCMYNKETKMAFNSGKERDLVIKVYSTSLMPNLFSDFFASIY